MSRVDTAAVRQPMCVTATSRRRPEEHIGVRFPSLLALVNRAWLKLPPGTAPRRALMRRTVRLAIEAANRRDYEAAFALYDARAELLVPPDLVAMGFEPTIRGREERVRFEVKWRTEWGEFSYVPQELSDLGDRVLLLGRVRGSGPSSGAAFDSEWADLFTISAGRVVREQVFLDHGEALDSQDS